MKILMILMIRLKQVNLLEDEPKNDDYENRWDLDQLIIHTTSLQIMIQLIRGL